MSGTPTPSSSSSRSLRRYSIVLAANASSWTDEPGARLGHGVAATVSSSSSVPVADDVALAAAHRAVVEHAARCRPVIAITSRADGVEQRDAGRDEDLGTEVGVAPGDARRGVDHGGEPAGDQRLGADPVEVDVVDDGDVAGPQALGEVLGAPVHAGGTAQPGSGPAVSAAREGEMDIAAPSCHVTGLRRRRAAPRSASSSRACSSAASAAGARRASGPARRTRSLAVDLVRPRCG